MTTDTGTAETHSPSRDRGPPTPYPAPVVSELPTGPWSAEASSKLWLDTETGLPCAVLRMPTGTLNGYVAVPEGHHLYLKDDDKLDVSVHGGLTYSAEGDGFWWFGFDTSHCYDLVPARPSQSPHLQASEIYRDLDYVSSQTTQLAQQLAAHSEIVNAAAAPDLYAALQAFLKIEFMNLEEDDELKAAHEQGRAAIRKALG